MASSVVKPTFDSFSEPEHVLGVVIDTAGLLKAKAFAQVAMCSWVGVFGNFSKLRSASHDGSVSGNFGECDCMHGGRVGGNDGGKDHMFAADTGDCKWDGDGQGDMYAGDGGGTNSHNEACHVGVMEVGGIDDSGVSHMGGKEDSNDNVTEGCVLGGGPVPDEVSSVMSEGNVTFGGSAGGGGGPLETTCSCDASKESGTIGGCKGGGGGPFGETAACNASMEGLKEGGCFGGGAGAIGTIVGTSKDHLLRFSVVLGFSISSVVRVVSATIFLRPSSRSSFKATVRATNRSSRGYIISLSPQIESLNAPRT